MAENLAAGAGNGTEEETMRMRRLNAIRFREYAKLDAESIRSMAGRDLLTAAYFHLKQEPALPENISAIAVIERIVGQLEDETRELFERKGNLWSAILRLDGPTLSNPEIAKEQDLVRRGIEWLDRIMRRLAASIPEQAPLEAIHEEVECLNVLVNLRGQLWRQESVLEDRQCDYQMARAKAGIDSKFDSCRTYERLRGTPLAVS
jgi:arsenate reductase-like glutaredoxin family protein